MRTLILFVPLLLAACAPAMTSPVPINRQLTKPTSLMVSPKPLPTLKEGDSLYDDAANCRYQYGKLSTQVLGLQNYVRVITNAK